MESESNVSPVNNQETLACTFSLYPNIMTNYYIYTERQKI